MKNLANGIIALFLLSACSSSHEKSSFQEGLVSTSTAIKLAESAYIKGCVDAHTQNKWGKSYIKCQKLAKEHIKANVLDILNQSGE